MRFSRHIFVVFVVVYFKIPTIVIIRARRAIIIYFTSIVIGTACDGRERFFLFFVVEFFGFLFPPLVLFRVLFVDGQRILAQVRIVRGLVAVFGLIGEQHVFSTPAGRR